MIQLSYQWEVSKLIQQNRWVIESGVPNFMGCRIPVKSNFNIEKFAQLMETAPDKCILEFIRFGCPIEHDSSPVSQSCTVHAGAKFAFEKHIEDYLQVEMKEAAIIGPFDNPPFDSPCTILVAKKDSNKCRVILDLSFLAGKSVNDGLSAEIFLGKWEPLVFPSIDNLIQIVHKIIKKKKVLLFKWNRSRTYRWLPVDVGSIHLLGYWSHSKFYFNLVLPMGLHSSACFCQMLTDVISYIFSQEGFEAVNYIEDFGVAEAEDTAWQAFYSLGKIISDIGLREATEKASPPSSVKVFFR